MKDGNGNRTVYEPDAWGRTAGITKPDGSTEAYLYDHAGNMTSSTDGEGNTTLYAYDLAGNMVSITDPTGETERYAYDREGNAVEKTDRNGVTTQYAFNMYGAPLYRRVKDGALEESYRYTPEGRLESALSAGMRYSYEYDAMGRISRKSASGRTLLAYEYDLNGNLTRQTDVTGKTTEYNYNSLNFIEKVADNGTVTAEYSYYPDGSIRSLKNGSLYTEYAYDADRNLSHLKTMLGTEVLADSHYTYDPNGNRTEKRQISGVTRYTYDALNRLTKVQYPSYTEELYYDGAGNRIRRMTKGVEELYQYDPGNRLTEYTKGGVATQFTYDKAGNLLKDNKAEYTYDAFNRTEKAETFDGHVQINRYDAEGLRHEMEEDGKLVQFIFRGDEIVTGETENKVIRFIRGYDLVASDAESARTYYHYASDEMSSITHVVTGEDKECREEAQQNPRTASSDKTDAVVLNRYEYDAWGNTTVCEETVENRFKFNGQQLDPVTQQYYLRARFYNPVIARFTQEDTYRGDGLNLYAYCKNNPVYYVDPSGHWCDRKEKVYKDLLKERGITEADLANDPDLKLSLMAEASNIVKSQKRTNSSENKPNAPEASNQNAESGKYSITVLQDRLQHSVLGEFNSNGRLINGGHGQANIDFLNQNNIEYNIVKVYDNGVRVGNIPSHKNKFKRTETGQAWFPESWTEIDIKNAGEYVANIPENVNVPDGTWVFGEYNGVRVGIIKNNGKIGTIIPDNSRQP